MKKMALLLLALTPLAMSSVAEARPSQGKQPPKIRVAPSPLNDEVNVPSAKAAAKACPLCEQAKNHKFESYALSSIVSGLDAINRPLVYASPTGSGIYESVSVMESQKAYENYIKEVQWAEVKSAAGSHEAVFENFGRFADVKTQSGKN